ncbi:hypothetical protein [Sphingobacterium sp. UBA1498]|uniref:hypothetical protein n=1 Tax=Sphingobacterium sp. UBA1498 TaxID=1947481 RepID=UPI0025ED8F51|nr:hypothetical protein [Sphingobacterium sp. UBA1498]
MERTPPGLMTGILPSSHEAGSAELNLNGRNMVALGGQWRVFKATSYYGLV